MYANISKNRKTFPKISIFSDFQQQASKSYNFKTKATTNILTFVRNCDRMFALGDEKNMKKKKTITKDMTIGEVLSIDENLAEIFLGFGMHCVSCPVSQMETIEEASAVHGVDTEFLLKKLNENVK